MWKLRVVIALLTMMAFFLMSSAATRSSRPSGLRNFCWQHILAAFCGKFEIFDSGEEEEMDEGNGGILYPGGFSPISLQGNILMPRIGCSMAFPW